MLYYNWKERKMKNNKITPEIKKVYSEYKKVYNFYVKCNLLNLDYQGECRYKVLTNLFNKFKQTCINYNMNWQKCYLYLENIK
jgi:hypothetical protein